jgi:hypothetical protein
MSRYVEGARYAALERAITLKEQLWGEEGGEDKYVACSLRQVRSGQVLKGIEMEVVGIRGQF